MARFRLDSLSIGALSFEGVEVLTRDYNTRRSSAIKPIDGILGYHLFREYLLTINYPEGRVTVSKGELSVTEGSNVLPLVRHSEVPEIEISIGDRSAGAIIDTGSMGAISIPGALADSLKFTHEPKLVGRGKTVSGEFEIRSTNLDGRVRIGTLELAKPEIMIAGELPQVNIGSRTLSSLAITFDQKNARVLIERPLGRP